MVDRLHRRLRQDRHRRELRRRPSRSRFLFRRPSPPSFLAHPDRQASSLLERFVLRSPVADAGRGFLFHRRIFLPRQPHPQLLVYASSNNILANYKVKRRSVKSQF